MTNEIEQAIQKNIEKNENPYLLLGFWEFAIMSTLMVVVFPWSLLFCVLFYGLTNTKYIIITLFHDAVKTFLAVAATCGIILLIILGIVFLVGFFS